MHTRSGAGVPGYMRIKAFTISLSQKRLNSLNGMAQRDFSHFGGSTGAEA